MMIKAVLTGDLMQSQKAVDTQAYLDGLKSILSSVARHYSLNADIYRGDGFQVVLCDPSDAFDCALAIRAGLIAASPEPERWDARIAIGLGPAAGAGGTYGEAFVLSGQGLDSMKRLSLAVFCTDPEFMRGADLATEFAAAIVDKWTVVEARAYSAHLAGVGDQQRIAEQLGKSRVAINKALQRAQARLLDRYLTSVRQWVKALDNA